MTRASNCSPVGGGQKWGWGGGGLALPCHRGGGQGVYRGPLNSRPHRPLSIGVRCVGWGGLGLGGEYQGGL